MPPGSKSVEVPPELEAIGLPDRTENRQRAWPFARQIHEYLKERDEPTAYIKINKEFHNKPGMQQALEEAKLGFLRQKEDKPSAILLLSRAGFAKRASRKS